MRCWNCLKEIPDDAKACQYCEVLTELAPSEEEVAAVEEVFDSLDEETLEVLHAAIGECETAEAFANQIMVGACPACESTEVGDCDHDPSIENICVGRCFSCGQLWCLDCGELFAKDQTVCEHEAICLACDRYEAEEPCDVFPSECPTIIKWQESKER